jgi:hypothetical protein
MLPDDQALFNTFLAKARIIIEHCIGLLKTRFRCLRGLRMIINDERSMKKVIDRIMACIILHDLLVDSDYPDDWTQGFDKDLLEDHIDYEYNDQYYPDYNNIGDGRTIGMK